MSVLRVTFYWTIVIYGFLYDFKIIMIYLGLLSILMINKKKKLPINCLHIFIILEILGQFESECHMLYGILLQKEIFTIEWNLMLQKLYNI